MPVSGEIIELNTSLESNPEVINTDAYGDGWLVKIKLSDKSELEGLLSTAAYQEEIGQ